MDRAVRAAVENRDMSGKYRRATRIRRRLSPAWLPLLAVLLTAGLVLAGCSQSTPGAVDQVIKDITPQAAFDLIQQEEGNPDFAILDVRTPEEVADGYIEGAVNIDFYEDDFRDQLDRLDRDKTYVIYCRSGGRSGSARDTMRELGFAEVHNILGGMNDWRAAGLPVAVP